MREKYAYEIAKFTASRRKNSKYSADMNTFSKRGLFTFFSGSNALYLVNIKPNSKLHTPPKISGFATAQKESVRV